MQNENEVVAAFVGTALLLLLQKLKQPHQCRKACHSNSLNSFQVKVVT